MNQKWPVIVLSFVVASVGENHAALVLSGTSYTQSFDDLGNGLPADWSVYTGATSASLGSAAALTTIKTYWSESSAGFYNVASAGGLTSLANTATQHASANRALGIKQAGTPSGYDSGAALVLQMQNTSGYGEFNLSLKAQQLNSQTRSTTWSFQYRIGDSGQFTTLGTFEDPGTWGSTDIAFNSSQLASWNDQASSIWFRVAALNASSGSGSRDMLGIDDFTLSYSAVPESGLIGWLAGAGLLGLCLRQLWRGQSMNSVT